MILALEIIAMLVILGVGGGGLLAVKAALDPQKRRIQKAATDAKVAKLQEEEAEARFKRSQIEINREIMEATNIEKLQAIHDAAYGRALGTGKE